MRRARVKVEGNAYYHVMSRCALQQFLLTDDIKEMFLKILRRAEVFSGTRVVNFCIMDNHFHLLVNVPSRKEVSDEELDERLNVLYGAEKVAKIHKRWDLFRANGAPDAVEEERSAFRKRMYDLSEFMKTFKQRFSLWYCSNHGHIEGTIWQGAFHSVLVEGRHDALNAISAYITLNPVRAGIVKDARDYAWSAYGAAEKGDRRARAAIISTYSGNATAVEKWKAYREMVDFKFAETGGREVASPENEPVHADIESAKNLSSVSNAVKGRERDISRGVAFGSEAFVLEAIGRASRCRSVRTMAKDYCIGEMRTKLCCAGRNRA